LKCFGWGFKKKARSEKPTTGKEEKEERDVSITVTCPKKERKNRRPRKSIKTMGGVNEVRGGRLHQEQVASDHAGDGGGGIKIS